VDLDDEGDRFAAREVIGALLKPWTVARSRAQIAAIFDAHDVCWGPYQTFRELVEEDSRCSTANPMFTPVEQPGIGTYLMPASPLDLSVSGRLPARPAPLLGQDTEAVLADVLGLSGAEIARLHDDGVVASPTAADSSRVVAV
jgi:2-methylfumaryl-CoA isomerase